MALVKYGGTVQDARGSQNGITYSRNKGGAYIRQKVSPVQPLSTFSSAARSIFAMLSQRWSSGLTASQRAGWVAFAATHTFVNVFGDAITLSGIAMYQSVNRAILQVGKPVIDSVPITFTVPAVLSVAPLPVAAAGVLTTLAQTTVATGAMPANGTLYVFATPPMSPGVRPQKSDYRLINPATFGAITLTTAFLADYNLRFATPAVVVGQVIGFRVAILDWSTGAIGSGVTVVVPIA